MSKVVRLFAFSLLVCGAVAFAGDAAAREKQTIRQGYDACITWCNAHNSSAKNRLTCHRSCDTYWSCHGSDATEGTCILSQQY